MRSMGVLPFRGSSHLQYGSPHEKFDMLYTIKKRERNMIFIKNGYIKTMAGDDIENGCILLGDDGKIAAVGADLVAPAGSQVIDAQGRLVTPGCVEAHSHIGLSEEALRWEGSDINEKSDPVTPQLRAIDGIRPEDARLTAAIRGGVTSVCTGPGSANVVGGAFVAMKLAGRCVDDMVIRFPAAMKCAFGENPKSAYGQSKKAPITRMATAALLRDLLTKSRNYLEAKESGKDPAYDAKLEAMLPVTRKEIPLKAHAHRTDDILTSIRIAREFDVNLTMDHCTEGHMIADVLAKYDYPALVGPSFGPKTKPEMKEQSFATAGILHKAGVSISIITDASVVPQENLPMCAGLVVNAGLPMEEGWKAITINPASHIGIADRVGSLEVGKDADVVIWTKDPLVYIGGEAYTTIIDGKVVFQR